MKGIRRCKARHGQSLWVRCEGEVTEQTRHVDDHHAQVGGETVRWNHLVAVYPERCRAHVRRGYDQQLVRCELEAVGPAPHDGDHQLGDFRWQDRVAIYPGSEEFRRQVDNDVARTLEAMGRSDVANPNRTQVGGSHYSEMKIPPWAVIESLGLDFFQGNALKCLMRAGRKGPALEDLKKAKHYIEKCIEREERAGG